MYVCAHTCTASASSITITSPPPPARQSHGVHFTRRRHATFSGRRCLVDFLYSSQCLAAHSSATLFSAQLVYLATWAAAAAQPQHLGAAAPTTATATALAHGQQSAGGGGCSWQWGDFSQTSAHLGFGQLDGRWHFHSQTDSQTGCGLVHSVWQSGSLHTVSHSGQRPFSQCFTGQRTSHSGLLHLIWHLEQPSSWQRVEHFGGSQIGSHTWLQTGLSHFHWHFGWQSSFSPQSPSGSAQPCPRRVLPCTAATATTASMSIAKDFIFLVRF